MSFLQEIQVKFSWSYANMPGLDLELVMHNLVVRPDVKLVKQKLHKMHPQVVLLVKVELQKILDVEFIKPIDYPKWLSNIVPISKLVGGIRICIDFRDLNKACLKDDFPLTNIDMIVDLIVRYEILSLMNGFSGYNQIRIT